MAQFEFKLPDIGEGVVEGEIVKWLVKPGDQIVEDQPLVEVMTDKATVTIPSPRRGKVVETVGKEGDIAKVHSTLVVLDLDGEGLLKPHQPLAFRRKRRRACRRSRRGSRRRCRRRTSRNRRPARPRTARRPALMPRATATVTRCSRLR